MSGRFAQRAFRFSCMPLGCCSQSLCHLPKRTQMATRNSSLLRSAVFKLRSVRYVAQEGDAFGEPPARFGRSLNSSARRRARSTHYLQMGERLRRMSCFVCAVYVQNAGSATAGLLQCGVGRICQDPRRSWQRRDVTSSCTCS